MRLEWVRVNRFRWVQPGATLEFRPQLNAIIGQNGAGKTTLLDLLAAIWSGDLSPYREEVVDLEWRFGSELGAVEVHVKNYALEMSGLQDVSELQRNPGGEAREREWLQISLTPSNSPKPMRLQASFSASRKTQVQFEAPGSSGAWTTMDDWLNHLQVDVSRLSPFQSDSTWNALLPLAIAAAASLPAQSPEQPDLHSHRFEGMLPNLPSSNLKRFEGRPLLRYWEGSDWAEAAQTTAKASGVRGDYESGFANFSAHHLPSSLQLAIQQKLPTKGDLPYLLEISSDGADPWLRQVTTALGMQQITLYFSLSMGDLRNGSRPFSYALQGMSLKKRDGSVLDGFSKLSHGQKRLFGFLWYLGCSPDVVIADELSNGMHWQMVETVLDAIGARQSFLAMQDPALLDHMEFESPEDVRHAFVSCSAELVDGREQWTWRSFSLEEATDLFDSYKKGFRHVNEILRTRGLW